MTYDEVMTQMEALGNESTRATNTKFGVVEPQFGVKMGDLRAIAKRIKTDPELASQLWRSGNFDAMMLAMLLINPKTLTVADLDRMVGQIQSPQAANWFGTNLLKPHPDKETLREKWMNSDHPITARMGWSLTTERAITDPDSLDQAALLDRIEREMPTAPSVQQWTMNGCLAEIGIHYPAHRARAIAIAEKIGAFKDYPTSKGCTSPYAPLWIAEMVRRQG